MSVSHFLLALGLGMVSVVLPASAAAPPLDAIVLDDIGPNYKRARAASGLPQGAISSAALKSFLPSELHDRLEGFARSFVRRADGAAIVIIAMRTDLAVDPEDFLQGGRERAEEEGFSTFPVRGVEHAAGFTGVLNGQTLTYVQFGQGDHFFLISATGLGGQARSELSRVARAQSAAAPKEPTLPPDTGESAEYRMGRVLGWLLLVLGIVLAVRRVRAGKKPMGSAPWPGAARDGGAAEGVTHEPPGEVTCPSCGESHAAGARYCERCGTALASRP